MTLGARLTVLIIITGLAVACGSQRPTAGRAASLVTGTVAAGPISPVARPGMPTTHTDETGRYELRLQPGVYLIRAQSDKYLPRERSKTVTLPTGQKLTVNLVLDTGIR